MKKKHAVLLNYLVFYVAGVGEWIEMQTQKTTVLTSAVCPAY